MTEVSAPVTELTSQYVSQVADDLEHNVKEQQRVTGEITELKEQLATLQHDHSILVGMQQALGVAATAGVPAPAGGTERRKRAAGKPTAEKAVSKRTGSRKAASRTAADKTAVSRAAVGTTAQPTLIDLVRLHLTGQNEPRSAAEVADALGRAHPDRGIQVKVVRTTLENLVARNSAQRTKQGTSVFYTASPASDAPAAGGDETRPTAAEDAGADE
ncbi:hypothetical protein ACIHEJ_30165 [Streptomyces sp. NPDC052301]|uniref:hypothetical protein n=1 Tax=Streptomyces sp. NPDC052301 TaxID=3365687 RepID=UPI0037D04B28